MRIVFIGLSLSSSWGNGHATTYRSLIKGLRQRGHAVDFFEREESWYAENRDIPHIDYLHFYASLDELGGKGARLLREADLVVVGSYVRQTGEILRLCERLAPGALLAYYDIDTPVTLAQLEEGRCEYLSREQLGRFDIYFSFSGGRALETLRALGARRVAPLYCSVDPDVHAPQPVALAIDLGYLGTWAEDREAGFAELFLGAACRWPSGRFFVAGPNYPDTEAWPENVGYVPHLPPTDHADFYSSQRFALNLTRADMRRLGHSPSVRLFEAASCGTPVVSDTWDGIGDFFRPGSEILLAEDSEAVLAFVRDMSDGDRQLIALAARERVLAEHTGYQRAADLEASLERLTQT